MQISTSQFYAQSSSLMEALTQKADKLQVQISSGVRSTAPSDDVVAYSQLAGLKRAKTDDTANTASVTLAKTLLQQSDSALTSVQNDVQQASELMLQANNGTLTDDNRKAIATQLQSVLDDLVSVANSKDVRGQPLFGAATGDTAVTQNTDGSVSFSGTGSPAAIPLGNGQSIVPTNSAQQIFGGVTSASGTSDMFSILSNAISALNAGGDISNAAKTAIDGLNAASSQIANAQGSVGARAARLDLVSSQMTDAAATRETDRTALEDTDTTAAITELQKTMTILSATQASFTKLSSLSLFDYLK